MNVNDILNDTDSKKSFLTGLVFIAKSDGRIDEREKVFFQNAGIALGLDDLSMEALNACWEMDQCPPLEFSNMVQKKFFIREAIQLCCIDEHYAEPEKAFVYNIANKLGVSTTAVKDLENWVYEGIAWKKQGDEFIRTEG